MKYYSATRRKGILKFVTTWLSLEGFLLIELRIGERQTLYAIIYIWNLKNSQKQRVEWWLPGAVGEE